MPQPEEANIRFICAGYVLPPLPLSLLLTVITEEQRQPRQGEEKPLLWKEKRATPPPLISASREANLNWKGKKLSQNI